MTHQNQTSILIIGRGTSTSHLLMEKLKQCGYHVHMIKTPEVARHTIEAKSIDMLLIDLGPEITDAGIDLTKSLQAEYKIPVVVLQDEDIPLPNIALSMPSLRKDLDKSTLQAIIDMILPLCKIKHNLEDEQKKYRLLFDSMLDGVCLHQLVFDKSGAPVNYRILDVNLKYEDILNLKRTDVIGQLGTDVYKTENAPYIDIYSRVVHTGIPEQFEVFFPPMEKHFSISVFSPEKNKFVTVFEDITHKKQSEEQIHRNENRLRSIVNILQYQSETTQEFLDYALNEAIELTESKIGYIYYYDGNAKQFILNSWSKEVMNQCSIANPQTRYDLDKTGMWGEAVRQRRPIILNNFQEGHPLKKGYPEGHAHLKKFMTVPIIDDNRIVAVVGVANKKTDYNESDVLQLTLLMNSVWKSVDMRTTQEALKSSEKRYKSLFKNNHAVMLIIDPASGDIIDANPAAIQYYGWSRKEITKLSIYNINTLSPDEIKMEMDRAQQEKRKHFFFQHRLASGEVRDVEVYSGPISIENQDLLYSLIYDITDRKKAEEKVRRLLEEKELILKEVHHRIKNNLTTMGSLLSLQAASVENPSAEKALLDARSRMISMSLLYDKLYRSESLKAMSVRTYIPTLMNEVIGIFPGNRTIQAEHHLDDFILDAKRLQTVGIIINELLTNIMKYAFQGRDSGKIRLDMTLEDEKRIRLVVEDNGVGLPESVDFEDESRFGFMVVRTLTEQLKGEISLDREKGTRFTIVFNL